jgi:hypothetical protein
MIIGIVIEIATILGGGGGPGLCFAITDWNLYNAQNWNNINTNWNNCL